MNLLACDAESANRRGADLRAPLTSGFRFGGEPLGGEIAERCLIQRFAPVARVGRRDRRIQRYKFNIGAAEYRIGCSFRNLIE
jgi:hypothetical protein